MDHLETFDYGTWTGPYLRNWSTHFLKYGPHIFTKLTIFPNLYITYLYITVLYIYYHFVK